MHSRFLTFLLLAPALVLAGPVYRWVDSSGQLHYGETPPVGSNAQPQGKVRPASSSAAPPAAARPSQPSASGPATSKPAANAELAAKNTEIRAKNCKSAREHIETLRTKTARRILIPQPDGSMSRMTDEQFEKSLADAQKTVTSDCL